MPTPQPERRYTTTLDDDTHSAALARMTADGLDPQSGRAEFLRRAVAAYLKRKPGAVRPGRPWPAKKLPKTKAE